MSGLYSGGTVGGLIASSVARFGDRPALADDIVRWSYRELGDAIGRFVSVFRSIGLKKGDALSILSGNRGAAPMSPDRLREAIGIFDPVFVQLYGQTEAPQCITSLRKIDHDVRGPQVMDGCWKRPEATAETLRGGWLHTGDVAVQDADGYLYIADRTKDMIISGGFNLYPREVEDALTAHHAVASAAVIGIPDEKWSEAVKAFVVLKSGADTSAAELQAHVKDKRGAPWSPKSIDFVETIPVTGLGKIDRKALRAPYWEGRTRGVA